MTDQTNPTGVAQGSGKYRSHEWFCHWLKGFLGAIPGRDELDAFDANSIRNTLNEVLAAQPPAAPVEREEEMYRLRDLIANHIACEEDCQKMPTGCGCALTAARAIVGAPAAPVETCPNCNGTKKTLYFSEQGMTHEERICHVCRSSAETATLAEQIEIACAAYAKATGYYVEFHRGLSSESSDRMRKGMRAAIVALQDAIPGVPQTSGVWQPIETAPKDGTVIAVAVYTEIYGWIRGTSYWVSEKGLSGWISRGVTAITGELGLAHPTHWQPLPSTPSLPRPMLCAHGVKIGNTCVGCMGAATLTSQHQPPQQGE
ncbi:MAG TPA: hypothetical protein VLC51_10055 [Nitrospira sp.]|nr:hypothetical protein [Nitrospira sp.]